MKINADIHTQYEVNDVCRGAPQLSSSQLFGADS